MIMSTTFKIFYKPTSRSGGINFYNIHNEWIFQIVSYDRICNGLRNSNDVFNDDIRNISIRGGNFDNIVIFHDVPEKFIGRIISLIRDKITDQDKLRKLVLNCTRTKLVFPAGLNRHGLKMQLDDELLI